MPDRWAPTSYRDLNAVLFELAAGIQAVLAGRLIGVYLQGSFAVGDFDEHSDVDFVVVTEGELTGHDVEALRGLHRRIYALESSWAHHLEGSYFPGHVLRGLAHGNTPLWYLDNGSSEIVEDPHCNTVVVRWVLREKGVPLVGPDPATLMPPIPAEALRRDILSTMTGWGNEILADPRLISNRFYQTFAVLSYCRMLHDLVNGTIGSKRAGAEWARRNLGPRWHDLIDRAWLGRPSPEISVREPADPSDLERTIELIREVMKRGLEISGTGGV